MADDTIDKALPNEPRKEFNLPGEKELQEQIVEEVQAEQAETSPEDVVETESEAEVEVEAEAEVEVEDDFEEGEEEVEQSLEEQTEVEEELQPTAYTVKIDGVEQEVTLDELRNGYSRQQDYTRKTQELAQKRKSFEDQQAELAKKDAIYAQLLPQLEASLNGELENEPDWAALYESDPIGYVREKDVWDEKRKKLDAEPIKYKPFDFTNIQAALDSVVPVRVGGTGTRGGGRIRR